MKNNQPTKTINRKVKMNMSELADLNKKLQEINQAKIELSEEFESKRSEKLKTLHEELGYSNSQELVEALINMGAAPRGSKVAPVERVAAASTTYQQPVRQRRRGRGIRISQEVEDGVVRDVKAGGMTSVEIAKKYNISVPSVQNIKYRNDLVNRRS